MLGKIGLLLVQLIDLYSYVLFIWAFGSWFPQFTVSKFYKFLDQLAYPYAKIFRGLIPPIAGFDFSVLIAFLVLVLVRSFIENFLNVF